MERMMSVEDKIKRAEEIYYKRKERDIPVRETIKKSTNEKKNIKLFKKMIKQIIICLMIKMQNQNFGKLCYINQII